MSGRALQPDAGANSANRAAFKAQLGLEQNRTTSDANAVGRHTPFSFHLGQGWPLGQL